GPACRHLTFDLVNRVVADVRAVDGAEQIGGRPAPELLLDHVRERLARAFSARERVVGLKIDGDGLYGHALIMHLRNWDVKRTLQSTLRAAAWALTRTMQNLRSGVTAGDPATFGSPRPAREHCAAACSVPARRASRLDPIAVLRSD